VYLIAIPDSLSLPLAAYWTAPEVLRNGGETFPISADVYSFGVLLWEMCARRVCALALPTASECPYS